MIARIWHGWTTTANADAYQSLLQVEIFTHMIAQSNGKLLSIELLRRSIPDDEVEFVTILKFNSLEDVIAFAGADYEEAVVWAKARALLLRYDTRSQHYDLIETRNS